MTERTVCYSLQLPHGPSVAVEWVREAEWDQHWAVAVHDKSRHSEVRRFCTYTEARDHARRVFGENPPITERISA